MSTMELDPAQLFDGFPEPVLLLEEGTVRYRNPAAGRVFPGLREGDRAPEELAVPTDAEFPIVCTGRVGARSFRMSVQDVGRGGLLAVLHPEHEQVLLEICQLGVELSRRQFTDFVCLHLIHHHSRFPGLPWQ